MLYLTRFFGAFVGLAESPEPVTRKEKVNSFIIHRFVLFLEDFLLMGVGPRHSLGKVTVSFNSMPQNKA